MWHCDACGAEGEDHFQVCWRCGAPRGGLGEPDEGDSAEASEGDGPEAGGRWVAATFPPSEAAAPPLDADAKTCPACGAGLDYRGEIPIRIGGPDGWSFFREWKELDERLWPVQVWACSGCRRLELYEGEDE